MGKAIIILVSGTIINFGIANLNAGKTITEATQNAADYYGDTQARNIANSMARMILDELADNNDWRVVSTATKDFFNGTAMYTVEDAVFEGDSVVKIDITANFLESSRTVTVYAEPNNGFIPPVVQGAFTAFGPINDAISDMIIDGRNWNWNLTLSPKAGRYAVSTGAPVFVNTLNGRLGGTTYTTSPATDIVPSFPEDPRVVETNASWPDGWPTTPDPAVGLPDGMLKNIAINELIPGSQYVTAYGQLSFPLRGVTYMEVPNGTELRRKKIGQNPEGILVLHSPATDALWNDIKTIDGSPFKGLLIMDNLFHIHMDILGGVAILTPNTVVNDCNGNQDHWIRYSSETLRKVTERTVSDPDRLRVISWYE